MSGLAKRLGALAVSLASFAIFATTAAAVPAVNGVFPVPGVETNQKIVPAPTATCG